MRINVKIIFKFFKNYVDVFMHYIMCQDIMCRDMILNVIKKIRRGSECLLQNIICCKNISGILWGVYCKNIREGAQWAQRYPGSGGYGNAPGRGVVMPIIFIRARPTSAIKAAFLLKNL